MNKWIKNFLLKPFGFAGGLYLYYSYFVWGEFYPLWYSTGLGSFLAFYFLGIIIFGVIPYLFWLWKKTKIWQNFSKKWKLDQELPDR